MLQDAMRAAATDDTELCPPYWPSLIWWLIHHKGPRPPRDDDRFERYDDLFQTVALLTFADQLGQADLRDQAAKRLQQTAQAIAR